MRYIVKRLEPLEGKSLIDIGSGLGEASVYFSLRGADVTAADISPEMLLFAQKLALRYKTRLRTYLGMAEDVNPGQKFDVIYAGNLLHHVNIRETLVKVKKIMHPESTFISWDPLAYNPVINIYRKIARRVRTRDEHPLTKRDIQLIREHFGEVNLRFFWLTTLIIFITMAIVQWRNPNRVRYWKKVVEEGNKWSWIYRPLEQFDNFLLRRVPILRWLCWNVVIEAKKPVLTNDSSK